MYAVATAIAPRTTHEKAKDAWANALLEANGQPMRVARRSDSGLKGGKQYYTYNGGEMFHHYHAILPWELVFDIGDDRPGGEKTPWIETVRMSHRLWSTLDRLGIPFLAGLTGGKGTHTHVYLAPPPKGGAGGDDFDPGEWDMPIPTWQPVDDEVVDHRNATARGIVNALGPAFGRLEYDFRLIAPNDGSRLVREFGARKEALGPEKTLWRRGGEHRALPDTKDKAYAMAGQRVPAPSDLPVCGRAQHVFDRTWIETLTGGMCPKTAACMYGGKDSKLGWSGFCDDCPGVDCL